MKLWDRLFKKKPAYTCPCCGNPYEEIPLCFGTEVPQYYYAIPPEQRKSRIELEVSLCAIDGEHFFHRGRLAIPIHDYPQELAFDVWTSIKKENFHLRVANWNNPERIHDGPYFGWLQSVVPTYGETLNLQTRVHESEVGVIPRIEVIAEGHPLQIDQMQGISYQKAIEIVNEVMRMEHLAK